MTLDFVEKEGTLRPTILCMFETDMYDMDIAIPLVGKAPECEMFLHFRDILNSHPELIARCNELRNLAKDCLR